MTEPDSLTVKPPASAPDPWHVVRSFASGPLAGLQVPWLRSGLLLAGGLVALEGVSRFAAADGGAVLGLGVLAGGWWFLSRRRGVVRPDLPDSVAGWISRCEGVLDQLERLEEPCPPPHQEERHKLLEELRTQPQRTGFSLALVGCMPPPAQLSPLFAQLLGCPAGLRLQWGHPLPATSGDWRWPDAFQRCDVFLYHLHPPLRAVDLRWLDAIPAGMPVWLLIQVDPGQDRQGLMAELQSQWPAGQAGRTLVWSGIPSQLVTSLAPLAQWLRAQNQELRGATLRRCLEGLHRSWQADLEGLRRQEWLRLQQRTQWIVAAAVFAAPLPSLDLLLLGVVNGLMLKEMARLWDCPWNLERLRLAALELARACLAMGLVEWSSQALAGAAKLHGATWLVGGAMQALSAAYLTRIVGHAMADILALSAGVAEPDLETIKRQAPLLVARAAEAEKIDWAAFLRQGREWLHQRPGMNPTAFNTAS